MACLSFRCGFKVGSSAQALDQLHHRTASMPLPFGGNHFAYVPVRTSLPMDSVTEHSLAPRQAGVRKV